MALTWEKLKAFGNIVKRTSVPTVTDCTFDAITIWVNTITDIGYLINGTAITPLPVTLSSVPDLVTGISVADLQAALSELQATIDNMITSDPTTGQYEVSGVRLDADKKVVITYDDSPMG